MCHREPRNTTSKTSSRFPERSNMWSCTSECVFFSPPSYLPDVPDVSSRRRGSIACLFALRRLLHCLCGFDFSINPAWLLESCSVFQTWGAISDCFRDLQGASGSGYCPAVVSKCSTIQLFLLLVIIVSRAPPFSLAFSLLGFLVEISDEQRFLSLWFFLLMLHIIVLCHLSLEITKICEFWSLWLDLCNSNWIKAQELVCCSKQIGTMEIGECWLFCPWLSVCRVQQLWIRQLPSLLLKILTGLQQVLYLLSPMIHTPQSLW